MTFGSARNANSKLASAEPAENADSERVSTKPTMKCRLVPFRVVSKKNKLIEPKFTPDLPPTVPLRMSALYPLMEYGRAAELSKKTGELSERIVQGELPGSMNWR